jgi:hypothetical protein
LLDRVIHFFKCFLAVPAEIVLGLFQFLVQSSNSRKMRSNCSAIRLNTSRRAGSK